MVDELRRSRLRISPLDRVAFVAVGVMVALSVLRAFGPLTYGSDIWRQTDTASFARNYAQHGMALFFPQINWGGAGPGYVESELPIMPWLSAALYLVFGEHPVIGRLLSLVFILLATVAFAALVRRRLPPVAASFALIMFAVSPVFMRYATAFMPEATVLAFYVGALWAFDRWLTEDRPRWLVVTAASVAMAGLAKPSSLHVLIVLLVWLIVTEPGRLRRWYVAVAAVLTLAAPVLWMWHAHQLYVQYGNTFGVLGDGDDKFGGLRFLLSPQFFLGNLRIEGQWILAWVGVPFALVGWWQALRGRPRDAMLVGGLVGLALFYVATARYSQSSMGIQYHVFSLPFAAVAVGLGVHRVAPLLERTSAQVRRVAPVALAVALALVSVAVFMRSHPDTGQVYEQCAAELDEVSAPSDLVAVSSDSPSVDDGVSNNWQEPMIFYFADRRGWSVASDRLQPEEITADRRAGARWFVAYDQSLLDGQPAFVGWLATNATSVRPLQGDGCGIWLLH